MSARITTGNSRPLAEWTVIRRTPSAPSSSTGPRLIRLSRPARPALRRTRERKFHRTFRNCAPDRRPCKHWRGPGDRPAVRRNRRARAVASRSEFTVSAMGLRLRCRFRSASRARASVSGFKFTRDFPEACGTDAGGRPSHDGIAAGYGRESQITSPSMPRTPKAHPRAFDGGKRGAQGLHLFAAMKGFGTD